MVLLSVLCALVIGACLLARHNVRLGRADSRNAFRLSGFLFVLGMVSWVLSTHHITSAGELIIFMMGLSINLLVSALIWVLYVALEPFVRKRWPQTMISWTRVLGGRLRDQMVGGHLLVGIFFGVFSALATEIIAFGHGHNPPKGVQLNGLRWHSARMWLDRNTAKLDLEHVGDFLAAVRVPADLSEGVADSGGLRFALRGPRQFSPRG